MEFNLLMGIMPFIYRNCPANRNKSKTLLIHVDIPEIHETILLLNFPTSDVGRSSDSLPCARFLSLDPLSSYNFRLQFPHLLKNLAYSPIPLRPPLGDTESVSDYVKPMS